MPDSAQLQLVTGDLPAIERQLARLVEQAQQAHPLAPQTILIENTMLAPYLRQQLAFHGRGHINLHIMTPARLAERLSQVGFAQRNQSRLPRYGDRVLARRTAESVRTTYFWPVAHSPGFAESLRSLIRELTQAGITPDQFAIAAGQAPDDGTAKLSDLARLYRRFQDSHAGFFSPEDAYRDLDLSGVVGKIGQHVLVYGLWRPTGNQRTMFLQLLEAGISLTFFLPETGTDADEAHQELRDWLERQGVTRTSLELREEPDGSLESLQRRLFQPLSDPATHDGRVRLLSAPDAPGEVREAARACLRWAEEDGIPFHRMAVVYRQGDPYRTLIDQIFRRAGITTYLHSGRPLIEHPVGQRLAGLLNLVGDDLPRPAVMEFITETVLPKATLDVYESGGTPVQPARWDRLSREAGIVAGRDQWISRLNLLASSRREFQDPDADEIDEGIEEEVAEINRLRQFVETLAADLDDLGGQTTWKAGLDTLRRVACRYIDGVDEILEELSTLESLDELDATVPFERFRETVRFWLSQKDTAGIKLPHAGDNGESVDGSTDTGQFMRRGVNVIDIGSLRHLRFEAVIILGVAERQFPPPPRQDPLLLDRERSRLNQAWNWTLPLRAQGANDEALTFHMATSAASARLQISFPRTEAGSTRSHLPSHFFRSAAAALTGKDVEASKIDTLPPEIYSRIPAGSFMPVSDAVAASGERQDHLHLDEHEYDRALLENDRLLGLAVVEPLRPSVARARTADLARRRSDFTEFDGFLDSGLASHAANFSGRGGHAFSPSRLEMFATCPFKYFLRYELRLEKVEDPEMLERIGAVDRGSLIHAILDQFMTELAENRDPPAHSRRSVHIARLHEIASNLSEEYEEKGLVGYRVLWEFDQIAIHEDLEEWYDREMLDFEENRLSPETFELRFGRARIPGEGGKGSRDEPFQLRNGHEVFRFQGRADRVDTAPDRSRFRVIDYKTGQSNYYQKETLNGGRSLQLPIYLLATADLLDIPWVPSQAQYFFPTRRGEFKRVELTGRWLAENQESLVELLREISGAISQGVFPQIPVINRTKNCRNCDFQDVCPVGVERIAQRKRNDERVYQLRQAIGAEA